MLNKTKKHLQDVNESYFEHMVKAFKIFSQLFSASLMALIHAIFPFLFTTGASKKIKEKLSLRIIGKNLLNPRIDQTQVVTIFDASNTIVSKSNKTVQSYKRGSLFNIGFSYKF